MVQNFIHRNNTDLKKCGDENENDSPVTLRATAAVAAKKSTE